MAPLKDVFDNTAEYVPTSCAVCVSCFRRPTGQTCYFGGPFRGYALIVKPCPEQGDKSSRANAGVAE